MYCERACVLVDGRLHRFASVDEAYAFYNELPATPPQPVEV